MVDYAYVCILLYHAYCCTMHTAVPSASWFSNLDACSSTLVHATHVRCTWAYNCSPDHAGKSTTVKYIFSTHGILHNHITRMRMNLDHVASGGEAFASSINLHRACERASEIRERTLHTPVGRNKTMRMVSMRDSRGSDRF